MRYKMRNKELQNRTDELFEWLETSSLEDILNAVEEFEQEDREHVLKVNEGARFGKSLTLEYLECLSSSGN